MDSTSFPVDITHNTTPESSIHTLFSEDTALANNTSFMDYTEYKVSRWSLLIYRPICSTFGMTGNILSIVVFLTTSLRHSPTAIYMVTLAALDWAARWCTRKGAIFTLVVAGTISLGANFVHLVALRLNPVTDGSYRGRCSVGEGLGRKAERFKRGAGINASGLSENRLAHQQEQSSRSVTQSSQRSAVVEDERFRQHDLEQVDNEPSHQAQSSTRSVMQYPHLSRIVQDAENIPNAKPDVTNIPTDRSERQVTTRSNSSAQLTRMLLTVSVTFLVLTLPAGVFVVLFRQWNPSAGYQKALFSLVRDITFNLMYTNHAINFLLYCLSGTRFRAKAASIIFYFCRARGVP
ncbi:hypothetical protein BaRGS_00019277 [Batillaria attramentaria]|uniref:G-protein coupled receptors family 1 profile domain-containing protein n=1 Tax=Batillaria attramentaria TaxID=370345 RepID=A0ABD0KRD2_9CAEN